MAIKAFCDQTGWTSIDTTAEQKAAADDLKSQIEGTNAKIVSELSDTKYSVFYNAQWKPFYDNFNKLYKDEELVGFFSKRTELCAQADLYSALLATGVNIGLDVNPTLTEPLTGFDLFWFRHKMKVYVGLGILTALVAGPPILRLIAARRRGQDIFDASSSELEQLRSNVFTAGRSAASAAGRGVAAVGRGAKSAARGITKGGLMVAAPGLAPAIAMSGAPKRRRKSRR